MNKIKAYRDSLLSALCIISWIVIVFRIFTSSHNRDGILIHYFSWTWAITILISITGGLIFHFYALFKKRSLKYSFAYNLFATSNLIFAVIGFALQKNLDRPTPYLVAASFAVGIVMYKNIFGNKTRNFMVDKN